MSYKWCAVPECKNTSIKTPEKLFVCVPKNAKIRRKWLQLSRRNPKDIVVKSNLFFCEDHFDMEKDMANFTQYKMGFSQRIIMVDGVLPSKFNCQQDRKKRKSDAGTSRSAFAKRLRMTIIQECQGNVKPSTSSNPVQIDEGPIAVVLENRTEKVDNVTSALLQKYDQSTMTESALTADKSVQFNFINKIYFRSKAVQTKIQTRDILVSPFKELTVSCGTSPFKLDLCPSHIRPSKIGRIRIKKRIGFGEERSDSDVLSLYKKQPLHDSSSFTGTSSQVSDSSTSITQTNEDIEKMHFLQNTLNLINKKPRMYIGISKECYFIVDLIHKHTAIPHQHILMCLKKIRLNNTFSELADNLGLSLSYCSKLFLKNIPLIASVLQPFIVKLNRHSIKKTLPIAFRNNYYNISCIIDCLEIDIEKPSKALYQALTWSDYKKGNTVKYLISCTPNGLVNYISPGFGGRASDVTIVENCDFLDNLMPGAFILADRGFKHVEHMLNAKGVKLLRPPSVASGTKLSKTDVRQTKIIASLRIHIERVIRRIREFYMLRQHSVINKNFLRVLDDVLVISCALINLQDSLIK